jgi:hypothetical protein
MVVHCCVTNFGGFSDFRLISLLPCLSKVCEVSLVGQMNRHMCNFGLLCPIQSGPRRHHSTTTAVLKVTEDIGLNLEDGQAPVLIMLDFTQAFDNLNGVVVGYADCYSKGPRFESRVSHGPFQKV